MKKYEFIEHTADIKFRAYGKTLEELYENSGLAVSKFMYEGKIEEAKKKKIKAEGEDLESLMYNFIEEILFLVDSEGFLTAKAKVKISADKKKIEAELYGDSAKNYKGIEHIKSITYNEMFVRKTKNGWAAQAVLDI